MVVRVTLLQIALSAVGFLLGGWFLAYTYLRRATPRGPAAGRALADRLRRPAATFAEVEAQSAALDELCQFPDTEAAVQAARELLPEFDANVRVAALEVLRKTPCLRSGRRRDLRQGRPVARLRAIEALGEVGDERAIEALIDMLGHGDAGVVRALGSALFMRDRDHATDRLADALSSPDRCIAERAAGLLVGLGGEAIEPLMSQLVELRPEARQLAIESLEAIGDDRVVPALLPLLEMDPAPEVRAAALDAVAALDRVDSASLLRELALSDPDASVRARAVAALAAVNAPGTVAFLLAQLAQRGLPRLNVDEDREMPSSTAEGEAQVTQALILALKALGVSEDEIARVRREADLAAAELRDEAIGQSMFGSPVVSLTARDPVTRAEAVREVSVLGTPAAAHLHSVLNDPDPMVRADAARALGRIGAIASLQWLSARLQDPVAEVRLAAVAAVRAIVTRDAARELPR